MNILKPAAEHIDQMYEIEKQSFKTPWSYKSLYDDVLSNQISLYLIALINEQVVGYAGTWYFLKEAHITNIAVREDFRHQKVGESLMRKLFDEMIGLGIENITLEVRKSNIPAINLYEKLGFIQNGLRKKYYSDTDEDALIMWKRL